MTRYRHHPLACMLAISLLSAGHASPVFAQSTRINAVTAGRTLTEAALAEFKKHKPAARIELGVAGSAGSLARFCSGETDLALTARPILKDESAACEKRGVQFVEMPIALDAIAVVVNRRNSFVSSLSLDELRRIWESDAQGKITLWSQVDARFPNTPLKLLGPDSRFELASTFTEAVLGPGKSSRRDYMVSVDDDVLVRGVARDAHALAYVSLASYGAHRHELKAVPVAAQSGRAAVEPTIENVARGLYQPLSRPLLLYVNAKALDAIPVREFAEFYVANGARLARAARLVPLAEASYASGLAHLRKRSTGSAWAGVVPTDMTVQELQKRQAAL